MNSNFRKTVFGIWGDFADASGGSSLNPDSWINYASGRLGLSSDATNERAELSRAFNVRTHERDGQRFANPISPQTLGGQYPSWQAAEQARISTYTTAAGNVRPSPEARQWLHGAKDYNRWAAETDQPRVRANNLPVPGTGQMRAFEDSLVQSQTPPGQHPAQTRAQAAPGPSVPSTFADRAIDREIREGADYLSRGGVPTAGPLTSMQGGPGPRQQQFNYLPEGYTPARRGNAFTINSSFARGVEGIVGSKVQSRKDEQGNTYLTYEQDLKNVGKTSFDIRMDPTTGALSVNKSGNASGGYFITQSAYQDDQGNWQHRSYGDTFRQVLSNPQGAVRGAQASGGKYMNFNETTPQNLSRAMNSIALPATVHGGGQRQLSDSVNAQEQLTAQLGRPFVARGEEGHIQDLERDVRMGTAVVGDTAYGVPNPKRTQMQGVHETMQKFDTAARPMPLSQFAMNITDAPTAPTGYMRTQRSRFLAVGLPEGHADVAANRHMYGRQINRTMSAEEFDALGYQVGDRFGFGGAQPRRLGDDQRWMGSNYDAIPGINNTDAGNYREAAISNVTRNDDGTVTVGINRFVDDANAKFWGVKAFQRQVGMGAMPEGVEAVYRMPGTKDMQQRLASLYMAELSAQGGVDAAKNDFVRYMTQNVQTKAGTPFTEQGALQVFNGGNIKENYRQHVYGAAEAYFKDRWFKDTYEATISQEEMQRFMTPDSTIDNPMFRRYSPEDRQQMIEMMGETSANQFFQNTGDGNFIGIPQMEMLGKTDDGHYRVRVNDIALQSAEIMRHRPEFGTRSHMFSEDELNMLAISNPQAYRELAARDQRGNIKNYSREIVQASLINQGQMDPRQLHQTTPVFEVGTAGGPSLTRMRGDLIAEGYSEDQATRMALKQYGQATNGAMLNLNGNMLGSGAALARNFVLDPEDGTATNTYGANAAEAILAYESIQGATRAMDTAENATDRMALEAQINAKQGEYAIAREKMLEQQEALAMQEGTLRSASGIEAPVLGGAQTASDLLRANEIAINRNDAIAQINKYTDDDAERKRLTERLDAGELAGFHMMYPWADTSSSRMNMKLVTAESVRERTGNEDFFVQEGRTVVSPTAVQAFSKDNDADFGATAMLFGEDIKVASEKEVLRQARRTAGGEAVGAAQNASRNFVKHMQGARDMLTKGLGALGGMFRSGMDAKGRMGPTYRRGNTEGSNIVAELTENLPSAERDRIRRDMGHVLAQPYQPALDMKDETDTSTKLLMQYRNLANMSTAEVSDEAKGVYLPKKSGVLVNPDEIAKGNIDEGWSFLPGAGGDIQAYRGMDRQSSFLAAKLMTQFMGRDDYFERGSDVDSPDRTGGLIDEQITALLPAGMVNNQEKRDQMRELLTDIYGQYSQLSEDEQARYTLGGGGTVGPEIRPGLEGYDDARSYKSGGSLVDRLEAITEQTVSSYITGVEYEDGTVPTQMGAEQRSMAAAQLNAELNRNAMRKKVKAPNKDAIPENRMSGQYDNGDWWFQPNVDAEGRVLTTAGVRANRREAGIMSGLRNGLERILRPDKDEQGNVTGGMSQLQKWRQEAVEGSRAILQHTRSIMSHFGGRPNAEQAQAAQEQQQASSAARLNAVNPRDVPLLNAVNPRPNETMPSLREVKGNLASSEVAWTMAQDFSDDEVPFDGGGAGGGGMPPDQPPMGAGGNGGGIPPEGPPPEAFGEPPIPPGGGDGGGNYDSNNQPMTINAGQVIQHNSANILQTNPLKHSEIDQGIESIKWVSEYMARLQVGEPMSEADMKAFNKHYNQATSMVMRGKSRQNAMADNPVARAARTGSDNRFSREVLGDNDLVRMIDEMGSTATEDFAKDVEGQLGAIKEIRDSGGRVDDAAMNELIGASKGLGKFNTQLKEMTNLLEGSTKAQSDNIKTVESAIKTFEKLNEELGVINSIATEGGKSEFNRDRLSGSQKQLLDSMSSAEAQQFMNTVGQNVEGWRKQIGQYRTEQGAREPLSEDERQARLMALLGRGGNAGRAARMSSSNEHLYEGGLDTMFGHLSSKESIDRYGAANRVFSGLQGAFFTGTMLRHNLGQPISQAVNAYQQSAMLRERALMSTGDISPDDAMDGAVGAIRRRSTRAQAFQREMGGAFYNAYQPLFDGLVGETGGGLVGQLGAAVAPGIGLGMMASKFDGFLKNNAMGIGLVGTGLAALGTSISYANNEEAISTVQQSMSRGIERYGDNFGGRLRASVETFFSNPLKAAGFALGGLTGTDEFDSGTQIGKFGAQMAGYFEQGDRNASIQQMMERGRGSYGLTQGQAASAALSEFIKSQENAGHSAESSTAMWTYGMTYGRGSFGQDGMIEKLSALDIAGIQNLPNFAASIASSQGFGSGARQNYSMGGDIADYLLSLGDGQRNLEWNRIQSTAQSNAKINPMLASVGMRQRDWDFYANGSAFADDLYGQSAVDQAYANAAGGRLAGRNTGGALINRVQNSWLNGDQLGATRMNNFYSELTGYYGQTAMYGTDQSNARLDRMLLNLSAMDPTGEGGLASAALTQGNQFAASYLAERGQLPANMRFINTETGLGAFQENMTADQQALVTDPNSAAMRYGYVGSGGLTETKYGVSIRGHQAEIRDLQREMGIEQFQTSRGLSMMQAGMSGMGSTLDPASGALKDLALAAGAAGNGLKEMTKQAEKLGFNIDTGDGRTLREVEDDQIRISRERQAYSLQQQEQGINLQQQRFDLAGKHFYERMGLQREQMDYGFAFQTESRDIQRNRQLIRQGQQMEDWSFNRSSMELGFAWQMEDFDRNLRYARGRERRDMLRQQERATIQHSMQASRSDVQRDRMEQAAGWSEEDYNRATENANKLFELQNRSFEMQIRQFEENRNLEEQQMQMTKDRFDKEKGWMEEQWANEDQQRLLTRQFQDIQLETQTQLSDKAFETSETVKTLNEELQGMTMTMGDITSAFQALVATGKALLEYGEQFGLGDGGKGYNKGGNNTVPTIKINPNASTNTGGSLWDQSNNWNAPPPPTAPSNPNLFDDVYMDAGPVGTGMWIGDSVQYSLEHLGEDNIFTQVGGAMGALNSAISGLQPQTNARVAPGASSGVVAPSNPAMRVLNEESATDRKTQALEKMVRLLEQIVAMGPGRVDATIYTGENVKTASLFDSIDGVYGRN